VTISPRFARLPAGRQVLRGGAAPLTIDRLRMISGPGATVAAPLAADEAGGDRLGVAAPEIVGGSAGRVIDPGRDDQRGARDGVKVDIQNPAWLVLGEGYNRGWRATCDGEDLGAPTPLQGFANAWRVEPGCTDVDFAWAPNRLLPPAYLISLIGCLALLAVLLFARATALAPRRGPMPDDAPATRITAPRAIAIGIAAGVILGFVFALRAGVVIGPAIALIAYRGLSAKTLTLIAAALLAIVVPILYLIIGVHDHGGYDTNLAVERIAAHWVGVGAVVLLGAALWRTLAAARAAHPARAHRPRRRRRLRRRAA
jgi:hypothetical protein